jgi:mono/diheme cytochrome c family protein
MSKLLTAGLILGAALNAQQSSSIWDGVYMEGQAARGKEVFDKQCAGCHGATLAGRNGPPLAGATFRENWNGLSAADLFEYIKKAMPRGQAGTLSREQTADIMAYMLTSNGIPAGSKELPTKPEALQSIRFEAAKPK